MFLSLKHHSINFLFLLFFSTDINECAPSPCINGGTCLDKINAYQCVCRPGYTGKNCETSELTLFL